MGKKSASKAEEPKPEEPAPVPVVTEAEPLLELPPLMPFNTSGEMPSYPMVQQPMMMQQPITTSYAAPVTSAYAAPVTTAYAAPATTAYAQPSYGYAQPAYGGYAGSVV